MMSLNSLHKRSWSGVDDPELIAQVAGYTDSEGRMWPSFECYRRAIEEIKPIQQTQWHKIYLKRDDN